MLRKVAVRGIEMELDDAGSGERAFVLVHGYTGSRDDFREHVPELAQLGRTIALDQRGHGGTTNSGRAEDYTLDGLVADLAAAFDALGLARADLLGHSLGGMVALRFTLAHPERVASLVLMDTSARPMPHADLRADPRGAGEARARAGRRARCYPACAGGRPPTLAPVDAAHASSRWAPTCSGSASAGSSRRWTRRRGTRCSRVLGEHEPATARLGEIRCPTLVLVGAEDKPFLEPADELERGISGAVRVTIPDAAHSPQLENPPAWAAAIRAHLARARR